MSEGGQIRWLYSTGTGSTSAPADDPLLSIGGDSSFITANNPANLTDVRGGECYNDTSWVNTLTNYYTGVLAQSLSGSVVHAAAGDWLLCVEQNALDSPSFSAADDSRGSIAKILTMSAADNSAANVTVTLDRPVSGLAVAGDSVRVAKSGNVFATVTEAQARTGLVDHSLLYWFKGDVNDDAIQIWVEPIFANGCSVEVLRNGEIASDYASQANILTDAEESPVNQFGRVIDEVDSFTNAGPMAEVASQELARQNGTLPSATTLISEGFLSPIWLRRTVPVGANPGECVFVLRVTSEEQNDGTPLSDFDSLNAGTPIVWDIDPPTSRTLVSEIDRKLYANGGARVTTTLTDQGGNPLVNRSLRFGAVEGSMVTDPSVLTDANGQVINTWSGVGATEGNTETITATISIDPGE